MLEGDDRRERRHLGCAAQNLGAVDDVHPHDGELVVGQLLGLVQNLDRRAHLADVVHQRRQAELAQQRPVDAERARLRHREDRDVHHVREGVVVVFLQRRQRDQGGAVLRHRLRQVVDELRGVARIGRAVAVAPCPRAGRRGSPRRYRDAESSRRRPTKCSTRSSRLMRPTLMCGSFCRLAAMSAAAAPGPVSPGFRPSSTSARPENVAGRSGCAIVRTKRLQLVRGRRRARTRCVRSRATAAGG